MAVLKCKMCGGDLMIEEDASICECEFCGTKQTVPKIDDEKKVKLFDRANRLRFNCEFDKAASVYETIISEYAEEAEGYWGLLLCKYGIEYVDDPATGKKIPTCHRSSFDSIMDDVDFEMVMENSDSKARGLYREEAKYIEEIRKGIIEVSGKESPYDIFICYKETDENGERTLDSVLAQDVYDELTSKGYRVFFSRISLEDKLGVEYEPYIFAALNSAKIMLAFGTSYDFYNAVWVKNEWSRYLKLMAKDKTKHLIPCFKGIDAYDIPKEFNKLQSQDMGKIGAVQDLLRGIDKLLRGKETEENIKTESVLFSGAAINENSFIKRGYMALEDEEWDKANEFFEQALNINAENGQAYYGEFLADNKCKNNQQLVISLIEKIDKDLLEQEQIDIHQDYASECRSKYSIMDIFTKEEMTIIFHKPFYYFSKRQSLLRSVELKLYSYLLENNKRYQRAKQFNCQEATEIVNLLETKMINDIATKIDKDDVLNKNAAEEERDAYYASLFDALESADKKAQEKLEEAKATYNIQYEEWMKKKNRFDEDCEEYNLKRSEYETKMKSWKMENESLISSWEKAKTVYANNKNDLEKKKSELEMEMRALLLEERLGAIMKKNRVQKKLAEVRTELNNLRLPDRPKFSSPPVEPIKPILETEPKLLTIDDDEIKDYVKKYFYSIFEQAKVLKQ